MPIPTSIDDLQPLPEDNFPQGTDTPDVIDNVLREHAAYIAQLRDDFASESLRTDLATTGAGKGAEMVAIRGGHTVQDFVDSRITVFPSGGDDTANIVAAFALADAVYLLPAEYSVSGLSLSTNKKLIGAGKNATVINYTGAGGTAIKCHASHTARNTVQGLYINNQGTGPCVGVSTSGSSFNRIIEVVTEGFSVGVEDNNALVDAFSARNRFEAVEANLCGTGFYSYGGNANEYSSCRAWNCTYGANLVATSSLVFENVNLESNTICVRAISSATASFFGGYIECGVGNENFSIDDSCRIDFYGPTVNGDRGDVWINPNTHKGHLDIQDASASFGRYTPFASASRQYIKNPDFSRALDNSLNSWYASNVNVAVATSGQESGTRYVQLTSTAASGTYSTQFTPERDVQQMTLMVRYRQISGTARIQVKQGATILAQYTADGVADSAFKTAIVRVPAINAFDGLGTTCYVEIFPDVVGGVGTVYVDQVWCVRGDFGSAPRGYGQSVEVLRTPQVLATRTGQAANVVDTFAPTDIPYSAVGMRLRIRIKSAQASTTQCEYLIVGTTTAAAYPQLNDRYTTVELTVYGTTGVQGVLNITSGANAATYTVELVEWILE